MKTTTLVIAILFTLLSSENLHSQNTVGLLDYQPALIYEGYNLFYPLNQPNVYLLNNCGEIVHDWTDSDDVRPANTAYLLDDGRLVVCKRPTINNNPSIGGGGLGATVEIRSWDNTLEWSYTLNNDSLRLHHDIAISERDGAMTIMMIAWESISIEEVADEGRDTTNTFLDYFWPDFIREINPDNDSIVWEWHALDHLIQDFDPTQNNFGVVSNHPELIDININPNSGSDWMHCNSIDYNKITDQVLLSVPFIDEVWIIDHSTTIIEAASHTGGNSGKGGDLIFRWGNDINSGNGTVADQELFNQHDVNWIDDHLPTSAPDYGKLSIFNNQIGSNYSAGVILNPDFDSLTYQYAMTGNTWDPNGFDAIITHPTPSQIFAANLSSFQILANGNHLLCDGRSGHTYEITPTNQVVWEYITPLNVGIPLTQGTPIAANNNNFTFRFDRYPIDYGAFTNRDLSPKGWIENSPNNIFCDSILNIENTSCIVEREVSGILWRDATYRASEKIIADCAQQTNTDVTFEAGNEIVILPGFAVEPGADFHAIIQTCKTNANSDEIENQK